MSFRRNNFLLTKCYFHSVQTLKKGSWIFFSDHQTKNLSSLSLQVFHTQQVSVTQPLTFQRSAVWWWCKPTFVWRNPWTSAAAWPARCPALRCRRRSLRWCPDGPAGRDGTEDTGSSKGPEPSTSDSCEIRFSCKRDLFILLTADAVVRLVRVLLSDGSTFPATTSSEPSKYLSKRFWVTSDTVSSGNCTVILLSRGEETWL